MEVTDCVVDTQGHCFFCLSQAIVQPQQCPGVEEAEVLEPEPHSVTSSLHSLQYLTRYLGIDKKNVFIRNKGQGQCQNPHLPTLVSRARLKVELCEGCARLTEKFSGLYQNYEKIKLEMTACLELIHENMVEAGGITTADTEGKISNCQKFTASEKLSIAEALRIETKEKSSRKLARAAPHCKLRKMDSTPTPPDTQKQQLAELRTVTPTTVVVSSSPVKPSNLPVLTMKPMELHFPTETPDPTVTSPTTTVLPVFTMKPSKKSATESPKKFNSDLNESIYKCTLCGNQFLTESDYTLHHQNFHMGVRHQCQLCDKMFRLSATLKAHMKKEHFQEGAPPPVPPSAKPRKPMLTLQIPPQHPPPRKAAAMTTATLTPPHPPPLRSAAVTQPSSTTLTPSQPSYYQGEVIAVPSSSSPYHPQINASTAGPSSSTSISTQQEVPYVNKMIKVEVVDLDDDDDDPPPDPLPLSEPELEPTYPDEDEGVIIEPVPIHPPPSNDDNPAGSSSSSKTEVRYQCTLCGKDYYCRRSYRIHYESAHMRVRWRCDGPGCTKTFSQRSHLTYHKRTVCGRPAPVSRCHVCGKTVTTKSLRRHIRAVHMKLKEFGCDLCGKKFQFPCYLKEHRQKVHSAVE